MGRVGTRYGWGLGCVVALALAFPGTASAAAGMPSCPATRKLGRGLANVFLSPADIPLAISEVAEQHGRYAATFWGPLEGLRAALARIVVGALEVVTFPLPLPRVGYGPIIQPEFPGT